MLSGGNGLGGSALNIRYAGPSPKDNLKFGAHVINGKDGKHLRPIFQVIESSGASTHF